MTVPAISDAVYVSFPTVDYSKCTEPTTLRCHSFIVGEGIVRPTTLPATQQSLVTCSWLENPTAGFPPHCVAHRSCLG